jgi:hypothetical protein
MESLWPQSFDVQNSGFKISELEKLIEKQSEFLEKTHPIELFSIVLDETISLYLSVKELGYNYRLITFNYTLFPCLTLSNVTYFETKEYIEIADLEVFKNFLKKIFHSNDCLIILKQLSDYYESVKDKDNDN